MFYEAAAIRFAQPLGEFYVASIPANVLLEVGYSHRLKAVKSNDSYELEGAQRELHEPRLKEIGEFIGTVEAAFPNSIILAANYREESGTLEDNDSKRWSLGVNGSSDVFQLRIPTGEKLAAIIDGQHRVFGFGRAPMERLSMPLVCAVYFDLPKPYQAFLFATINSNQKKVDRSLTYELFGYNINEEEPDAWTPDKLAVFLTRKLNTDPNSAFRGKITITAENEIVASRSEARRSGSWMISTATVVDGIVQLISSNVKSDTALMHKHKPGKGRSRKLLRNERSSTRPLRNEYVAGNDKLIYTLIRNYFEAVEDVFWSTEQTGYIKKTVGVQAIFDILRDLVPGRLSEKDISVGTFRNILKPAENVDFSNPFFQASGTGRTRIRNVIQFAIGLRALEEIDSAEDRSSYASLLRKT